MQLSVLADLSSEPAGPASAEGYAEPAATTWAVEAGAASSFGAFERSVGSMRRGEVDLSRQVRLPRLNGQDILQWLARRHQRDDGSASIGLCLSDPSRIWAGKMMRALAADGGSAGRINIAQLGEGSGALSVQYLALRDDAVHLHVYLPELRQRSDAAHTVHGAFESGCECLLQVVGPMEPASFEVIAQRLRTLAKLPTRRTRLAVLAVSPTARRLHDSIRALADECGDFIVAVEVNLADPTALWNAALGALGSRYSEPQPLEPAAAAAPAPQPMSLHDMLLTFAQLQGVRACALIDEAGQPIEWAVSSQDSQFDSSAVHKALAGMGAWLAHGMQGRIETFCVRDREGQQWMHSLTDQALPVLWVAFDPDHLDTAVAQLLVNRMADELMALVDQG
jgi:predicted regulator of Ras-like GTPase activity (Roadblock/LC7/MglB family)